MTIQKWNVQKFNHRFVITPSKIPLNPAYIEPGDVIAIVDNENIAVLIATAPKLLEALKSAVFELDQDGRFCTDEFKEVIAKAGPEL